ncbi:MAG: Gfo/Idh/MocA family oxidoreductase [Candidatus Lokiarchaeia archaeon]
MKILVIGLGSMGKRRLRNLKALKEEDVIAFDLREDRRNEVEEKYGIKTYANFEEAMKEKPEIFIISVPPAIHLEYQLFAANNNIHFFTEASVVKDGLAQVIEILKDKDIVGAASSTLRYHPAVKRIKELVDNNEIGKLCTFTHHSGQYLPDWHPWEKISDYYVSKKETGGGREIVPFELSWLTWIFGDIESVSGLIGNTLNMGENIDDVYHVLITFKSGLIAHLLVDVVSRFAYRHFKLLGADGVIEWDWNTKQVGVYDPKNQEWNYYKEDSGAAQEGYNPNIIEEMYIDEMKHFLNAVQKKEKYQYPLYEDEKILDILYKIEESFEKKTKINI